MLFNSSNGLIGIEVGSCTIKMAQIRKQATGYSIVDTAVVSRQQPWAFESWHSAPAISSAREIRSCLSIGNRFQSKQAACAATMALHDLKSTRIEWTQDGQLDRELVRNELEQSDRFDINKRQFDYWPVPAPYGNEGNNAIVMSIDGQWASRIARDIDSSGLCCQSLGGVPMMMARATELAGGSRGLNAMIDFGFTRSTFCLAWQGQPVFVRVLRQAGFSQVVNRVCEKIGIRANEAAQLLVDSGLPTGRNGSAIQKAIANASSQTLNTFCEEIKRTLKFLDHDTSFDRPVKVWLSGGGSTVANIGSWLSDRVDVPFEPWRLNEAKTIKSESLFANSIALSTLAWKTEEALV